MLVKHSKNYAMNMAFCINILFHIPLNKMASLKEMANCMIQSKNLPSNFWVEAVNRANYIQNQMPHKAVLHMTLEEAWTHVKPDVSTFKVFGSAAWTLIPNENHKAL